MPFPEKLSLDTAIVEGPVRIEGTALSIGFSRGWKVRGECVRDVSAWQVKWAHRLGLCKGEQDVLLPLVQEAAMKELSLVWFDPPVRRRYNCTLRCHFEVEVEVIARETPTLEQLRQVWTRWPERVWSGANSEDEHLIDMELVSATPGETL